MHLKKHLEAFGENACWVAYCVIFMQHLELKKISYPSICCYHLMFGFEFPYDPGDLLSGVLAPGSL